MTFHDWINDIRWKYFTNSKSGLIFKELMKEFRMVEQMTEKRFHYDWKTGRMKDTQSNSQATSNMRILERLINDACYSYEKKIKELEQENKRLKQGKYIYGVHGGSNDRK